MDNVNIDGLCGICLMESHSYLCIFDERTPDGTLLYEVMNDVCQLKISVGDHGGNLICLECHTKLLNFKLFKKDAQKARQLFQQMEEGMQKTNAPYEEHNANFEEKFECGNLLNQGNVGEVNLQTNAPYEEHNPNFEEKFVRGNLLNQGNVGEVNLQIPIKEEHIEEEPMLNETEEPSEEQETEIDVQIDEPGVVFKQEDEFRENEKESEEICEEESSQREQEEGSYGRIRVKLVNDLQEQFIGTESECTLANVSKTEMDGWMETPEERTKQMNRERQRRYRGRLSQTRKAEITNQDRIQLSPIRVNVPPEEAYPRRRMTLEQLRLRGKCCTLADLSETEVDGETLDERTKRMNRERQRRYRERQAQTRKAKVVKIEDPIPIPGILSYASPEETERQVRRTKEYLRLEAEANFERLKQQFMEAEM